MLRVCGRFIICTRAFGLGGRCRGAGTGASGGGLLGAGLPSTSSFDKESLFIWFILSFFSPGGVGGGRRFFVLLSAVVSRTGLRCGIGGVPTGTGLAGCGETVWEVSTFTIGLDGGGVGESLETGGDGRRKAGELASGDGMAAFGAEGCGEGVR